MQQKVEKQRGEWHLGPRCWDFEPPAKPSHCGLKRVRPPVGSKRDDFAVENQLARRNGSHDLDNFGHGVGDIVEAAGVHGNAIVTAVHLNAGSVELPFHNRRSAAAQSI